MVNWRRRHWHGIKFYKYEYYKNYKNNGGVGLATEKYLSLSTTYKIVAL